MTALTRQRSLTQWLIISLIALCFVDCSHHQAPVTKKASTDSRLTVPPPEAEPEAEPEVEAKAAPEEAPEEASEAEPKAEAEPTLSRPPATPSPQDQVGSPPPSPPPPKARRSSTRSKRSKMRPASKTRLGGVRVPRLTRPQLKDEYLPASEPSSEIKRQEPLERVDLKTQPLKVTPREGCQSLELIGELLSFTLAEALNRRGVNIELNGFQLETKETLERRLRSAPATDHLKLKLSGEGGAWYCAASQRLFVQGEVRLSTLAGQSLFRAASERSAQTKLRGVNQQTQRLVGAWRSALLPDLLNCLVKASRQQSAEGRLSFKRAQSARLTQGASCDLK